MISRTSLKMGHLGSKTRSLGQIVQKSYVRSWVHIFSPVLLKVGHNIFHDDRSFEMGHVGSKTRSRGQI